MTDHTTPVNSCTRWDEKPAQAHNLTYAPTHDGTGTISCECGWTISWTHHKRQALAEKFASEHIARHGLRPWTEPETDGNTHIPLPPDFPASDQTGSR